MTIPILLQRLTSVHEALSHAGFDHAVGGAIALAVHVQEPRFTADIDLNVMADVTLPNPLLAALPLDLEIPQSAEELIRRDGQLRCMWRRPDTPLDLFLPQHPRLHALVIERASPVDFLGIDIKVMAATDLMVFKVLFDRAKDWVDIEALAANKAGDLREAVAWLHRILGNDDPRVDRLEALWASVNSH